MLNQCRWCKCGQLKIIKLNFALHAVKVNTLVYYSDSYTMSKIYNSVCLTVCYKISKLNFIGIKLFCIDNQIFYSQFFLASLEVNHPAHTTTIANTTTRSILV